MNIRYLLNDLAVDEQVKKYIEEKLEKVDKLLEKVQGYEVDISRDKKGFFRVEIMILVPHVVYRAEEVSETIESATDEVIDELQQQIRRDKEKVRDLKERGARSLKKKVVLDDKARF